MQLLFLGDFLSSVFMGIIMTLDTFIYSLVNSSYRIFMAIASARLLSSDVYYEIANKIYIVVGVLMLFVLSYSILKAIVNPDELSKENNGAGIVKRIALAVIGLAITPVLFNVLYQAQGLFLEQDVLGKIFFRIDNTENVSISGAVNASGNPDEQIKTIGGAVAATSIWQAFFHPAEGANAADIKADPSDYYAKAAGTAALCGLGIAIGVIGVVAGVFTFGVGSALAAGAAVGLCAMSIQSDVEAGNELTAKYNGEEISLEEAYAIVAAGGDFDIFLIFMDNYLEDGEIEYFWGISTICGAFALYAFVSFSIDMGVRAAKLAYFQIIAPVPLVMQVLPKFKDTLGKYITQVVSTFVEVFIRISIVYIVTFVICHLTDLFSSFGNLWGSTSLNTPEKLIALALLIIGLIIFAKNAPEIITTSLSLPKGNMSLGIGKKLADGGAYAAGGVAGAGVTSAVRNWRSEGKGWRKPISAIAGMGSGMARAAFNQFGPGPGRKPAMTFGDMKNVAESNAQKTTNAKQARDERLTELAAAKKDLERVLADPSATEEQIAAARQRVTAATAYGAALEDIGKKIDAWSTASVSTAVEEAKIKFMGSLDGLKDKLRDKTAKKAYVQAAMDYEKELNARQVEQFDQASYQAAYSQYLATHQNATDAEKAAEATRLRSMYTLSDDEYRAKVTELSNLRTAAKKAREAAQDRAIVELAAERDAGVLGILTPFFQENADFIAKYKSDRFKIDKNGTEMTLGDLITQNFGEAALSGGFELGKDANGKDINPFMHKTGFRLEDVTIKGIDGKALPVTYQVDTVEQSVTAGEYVMVNEKGQKVNLVTKVDPSTGSTYYDTEVLPDQKAAPREHYKDKDFFLSRVFEVLAGGGKVDSETSTSVAGDAGKWGKSNIVNSPEYQNKVVRKQQVEDAKSGKK